MKTEGANTYEQSRDTGNILTQDTEWRYKAKIKRMSNQLTCFYLSEFFIQLSNMNIVKYDLIDWLIGV